MEVFKVDNRNRNDLLNLIEHLSRSYTPEWKFDASNPDALSVIGMIYANQTFNNIKNLNQLMTKYHIEFANMYGITPKGACAARTICTFNVNEYMQAPVALRKGTQVVGTNKAGDEVLFSLCHDIAATTSSLRDVFILLGSENVLNVYKGDFKSYNFKDGAFYDYLSEEYVTDDIPLFSHNNQNAYKQALIMRFDKFPDLEDGNFELKFEGNMSANEFAGLFSDGSQFQLLYLAEEGLAPFANVSANGEFLEVNTGIESGKEGVFTIVLEQKMPINDDSVDNEISIDRIELFVRNLNKRAQFLWNGKTEIVEERFMPFSNQPALYNEFYIGQEFLLERAGNRLKLHFKLSFDTYTAQSEKLYETDLRVIKRRAKKNYSKPYYRCFVDEVSIEYFNGKGWKRLETDKDMTTLFSKPENAGEYDICFDVPYDFSSVVVGGYDGNCIRLQIVKADNCYINEVEYCYPILSDFKLSMDGEARGVEPDDISTIRGQIKRKGAKNAFGSLQYDGDYIFLGFDSRFSDGPVTIFADMEKQLSLKGLELEYAYSAQNGFKQLKVLDDTNSFQNSGIIMFMPPADMNEYDVEGTKRFWIRIEDKNRYFKANKNLTPVIKNLYINAAYVENVSAIEEQDYYIDTVTSYMRFPLYAQNVLSADIWVNEIDQLSAAQMERLNDNKDIMTRSVYNFLGEVEEFYVLWKEVESFDDTQGIKRCYCIDRTKNELVFGDGVHTKVPQNTSGVAFKALVRCCDGEDANIDPYAIDRFRSSIISVEDVTNPIAAYGGTGIENMDDALERASNLLSSRRRLVSKEDFVREAYLFSDTIEQVACVVGNTDDGALISLVLLMKDYMLGDYSFRNIHDKLKEHLLSLCESTCTSMDLVITEPVFVKISIDLWLKIPDVTKSLEIKQLWLDQITGYFEPLKSSGSSRQIGKLPGIKQIRLMLSTLESTATIENINIMASYNLNGKIYNVSLSKIEQTPFMICSNGTHNIYINGV